MKKKLLVSAIAATAASTGAFAQITVENQNAGTDTPRVASGGTVAFENQAVRQTGGAAPLLNAGDTIVFSLPTGMNFVGSPTATASGVVRLQGNQLGDPNSKGLVTLLDTNNDGLNDRASVVVAATAVAGDEVIFQGSATWTGTHNAKAADLKANIFVSDKASGNAEVVDSDNVLAITVPALTAPVAQINSNANITVPNKTVDPVVFAGGETSNLILTVPANAAKDKTVVLTLGSGLEFDDTTTKVTVTALTDGAPAMTATDGTAGDNQYTLTLGGATTRDSQYLVTINGLEVVAQAASTTANVTLSGTAGLTGSAPVAILGASGSSAALVTGQNPTKIVAGSKIDQTLPTFEITETFAGDIGAGNVTVTAGTGLVFAGTPVATATGLTVGAITFNDTKTVATIPVTANSGSFPNARGTISVSGLQATATSGATGNLTVALGGTSANAPNTVLNVATALPRGAVAIKGPDPVPSVGAGTKGNVATFILDEATYAAIDSSASNTPIIIVTPPAGVTITNLQETGVATITDQGVKVIPENGSWLLYVTGETATAGDANVTVTYDVASTVAVGSPVALELSGNSNVSGSVTVANVSNATKTTVGSIPAVTEGSVNSQSLASFTITENIGSAMAASGNFRVIAPAGVTFAPGATFGGSVTATGSVATTFSANDTLIVSVTGATAAVDSVTVKAKAFVASTVANDQLLSFNITDANEANASKLGITSANVNLAYTGDITLLDAGAAGTVNVGFTHTTNIAGGLGPFTVTSSNPAVATVSVNDRAVTVRGVAAGTATITVTDSLNSTDTFAVTVNTGAVQTELTGVITSGGAASTAVLRAGASTDGGSTFATQFSTTDNLDVVGSVVPEAAHVGQAGEVFVVVRALVGDNNVWGMLNEDGNWQLWDARPDNLAGLVPARVVSSLGAVEHVDIHKGTLPAGTYRIRVGYMATGSSLIFNENPLEIVVE